MSDPRAARAAPAALPDLRRLALGARATADPVMQLDALNIRAIGMLKGHLRQGGTVDSRKKRDSSRIKASGNVGDPGQVAELKRSVRAFLDSPKGSIIEGGNNMFVELNREDQSAAKASNTLWPNSGAFGLRYSKAAIHERNLDRVIKELQLTLLAAEKQFGLEIFAVWLERVEFSAVDVRWVACQITRVGVPFDKWLQDSTILPVNKDLCISKASATLDVVADNGFLLGDSKPENMVIVPGLPRPDSPNVDFEVKIIDFDSYFTIAFDCRSASSTCAFINAAMPLIYMRCHYISTREARDFAMMLRGKVKMLEKKIEECSEGVCIALKQMSYVTSTTAAQRNELFYEEVARRLVLVALHYSKLGRESNPRECGANMTEQGKMMTYKIREYNEPAFKVLVEEAIRLVDESDRVKRDASELLANTQKMARVNEAKRDTRSALGEAAAARV